MAGFRMRFQMTKYIINGGKILNGNVKISGAKNSVLKIMAASILTGKPVTLRNVPDIEDVRTMADVLRTLGGKVDHDTSAGVLKIDNSAINNYEAPYELVRKMRASVLVAGPLLSRFGYVKVAIPGGCNIGARQIDIHLKGFEMLGAENTVEHGYFISKATTGKAKTGKSKKNLTGTTINFDFPSRGATENLMMAAVLASGKTILNNAAREAEIADLANFLISIGADITGAGSDCITINGVSDPGGTDYTVMPDSIEAGTFLTVAGLCGGSITVTDAVWSNLEIFCLKLKDIGIDIESSSDNIITVKGSVLSSGLLSGLSSGSRRNFKPVYISTLPYPGFPTDLQPIITVLLSVVPGVSIVTENVFENRFMYVGELNRMGANIKVDGHHTVIHGIEKLSGAPVKAFDLRAGAAMVLAGLIAEGRTEVFDIFHIKRGYENFENKLITLGADIEVA
jgi:UDP-N-acetylglucosamine 1-carboxyvinyltransferase